MTAGVVRAPQPTIRGVPARPRSLALPRNPARLPDPAGSPTTVATKLLVPPVPRDLVSRGRLLDTLDRGIAGTLVLLAAPAGAGKTVLLASWVRQRKLPGPVCWLTLDGDDADSAQLAGDLLSALRGCGVVSPGSALDRLASPRGSSGERFLHERFLPLLVNALSELSTPVVVVLDDVPELAGHPAGAALDYLVRHAPEQCRLVLSGRCYPPLPLERLRLADALSELRADDLAFDREETAELCHKLELELSRTEVSTLWTRTEGWAAAVRLVALALKDHPQPARFLSELAGADRVIADYLAAEALAHVSEDKREFMLRTSLVQTISPELADALTESHGAALELSELERTGAPLLPVTGYPSEDGVYRYHPLFRELLQVRLCATHPQQVAKLHRLAAGWYTEHGQIPRAIHHALAGKQLGKTLTAVHLHLERQRGHASEAEAFAAALHELERRMRRQDRIHRRGRIHRQDWSALRSFTLSHLGAAHLWCGEPAKARPELLEALALATEYELEHIVLDCQAQLAIADMLHGSLRSACRRAERALELAERVEDRRPILPTVAYAYLAGAAVAFRRGEFEHAEGLASRLARTCGDAHTGLRAAAGVLHAVILSAAGPESAERGALKLRVVRALIAGEDPGERPNGYMLVALADAEARTLSATGEHDAALEGLRRARIEHPRSLGLLVRQASVELRRGSLAAAARTLAPVIPEDPSEPLDGPLPHAAIPMLIEGWLLRALLAHADGERSRGARALERALELVEREPYHEAFLLGGPRVGELLEHQAESGTAHPAVLETLLQATGRRRHASAPPAEALTEREQTILRYLPTLLSNAEIGAAMYVSLNTVKTHLRSIYRKLDATNRADAVEKARQSGLLPAGIKRPHV
jgi:LuxR family maltose regulon positive regulatory protein